MMCIFHRGDIVYLTGEQLTQWPSVLNPSDSIIVYLPVTIHSRVEYGSGQSTMTIDKNVKPLSQ